MRYRAPPRDKVTAEVFDHPPLNAWAGEYADWLLGMDWPLIDALNARVPTQASWRFASQDKGLLADGLHYEQRIAERGLIATRDANWHDLFNAMAWLRHGPVKQALNARQVDELAQMGSRRRSRAQCAMTHFDEAGCIVVLRDPALLTAWDAHDWMELFWRRRAAWTDGTAMVTVFGHALLEHALTPGVLLVGKAVPLMDDGSAAEAPGIVARAIAAGTLLCDPQELRPLPLSGIPGWHAANGAETFHRNAACYRPLRPGRIYPEPLGMERDACHAMSPEPPVRPRTSPSSA